MDRWKLIGLVMVVVLVAGGCASTEPESGQHVMMQGGGMYSALDATSQVYSSPVAQAPFEDHPFRWVGFFTHPLGVILDYAINRPFYGFASTNEILFGYTSEDAMIESQRRY